MCTQQDCALAKKVCLLVSGINSNCKMSRQTDFFVFTFTEDFCASVCALHMLCVGERVCTLPLTFGLCTSTVCSNLLQPKQIHLNLLCNLLYISLFNPAEAQVSACMCVRKGENGFRFRFTGACNGYEEEICELM